MEAFDLSGSEHPYFVGVQYHPEYLTRPLRPSPPYLGLLLACLGKIPEDSPLFSRRRGLCPVRADNS